MEEGRAQRVAGGGRAARRRLRVALLTGIGVLYLFSVPWYRGDDAGLRLWLGLPDWVAVAVLCYAAAAVLNAIAWWLTDVDDAAPLPESLVDRTRGSGSAGGGAGDDPRPPRGEAAP